MIRAIKWLATICGLVFIGSYLAGARIPVLAVILVAFGLIFTHVKLRGPE
jgi:hypothetical protein